MYRKYAAMGYQASRSAVPMPNSSTPMEDIIRAKITAAFNPTVLEIENQSHLHAHHKAMVGSTSKETHFKLHITSEAFNSKMAPARHRMVYALLGEEMAREGGIHALSLRTTTPDEESKRLAKTEKASGAAVPVAE
ncbi:putative bolA-like protein YAL044W-A [Ceratocystis fimbriata CBS 114723]|uniref:Putative bolA-like protein YAL044W-A n=1 Tax=Ceratocystis fimbriata CBS 114723 TaxID=1035309 RepID=A0A2C5WZ08_9PEZI|nr:putative bolA-like protein YAL044W-A [Ceratocystis fimbriata CBS 114723]